MTRKEKIDKLQQEIWKLEEEEKVEHNMAILPLLQSGKIKLIYDGDCRIDINWNASEEGKKLFDYVSAGFYHGSIKLNDDISIHVSDGSMYLALQYRLKTSTTDYISIIKKLKLNLDFTQEIADKNKHIIKLQEEINKIEFIKSSINESKQENK